MDGRAAGRTSYCESPVIFALRDNAVEVAMMGRNTEMAKTILVAEDDPNDQFLIQRELTKLALPVQVRFVNDGEQTIAYLSALAKPDCQSPKPDLLFVDLKMPRLNGFELLEWMREHGFCKRVITVVVSSSNLQRDIDKAYDLGANAYVVKPASLHEYVRIFRATGAFFLECAQQPSLQERLNGRRGQ